MGRRWEKWEEVGEVRRGDVSVNEGGRVGRRWEKWEEVGEVGRGDVSVNE